MKTAVLHWYISIENVKIVNDWWNDNNTGLFPPKQKGISCRQRPWGNKDSIFPRHNCERLIFISLKERGINLDTSYCNIRRKLQSKSLGTEISYLITAEWNVAFSGFTAFPTPTTGLKLVSVMKGGLFMSPTGGNATEQKQHNSKQLPPTHKFTEPCLVFSWINANNEVIAEFTVPYSCSVHVTDTLWVQWPTFLLAGGLHRHSHLLYSCFCTRLSIVLQLLLDVAASGTVCNDTTN